MRRYELIDRLIEEGVSEEEILAQLEQKYRQRVTKLKTHKEESRMNDNENWHERLDQLEEKIEDLAKRIEKLEGGK